MRRVLRFLRRGEVVEIDAFDPTTTLLDWIRLEERSLGTKEGCNEGDCGACTVALGRLVGGRLTYEPVNACILLLGQVDGAELVTVEDLAETGLHPVQAALVRHHGSQCGFCTPGIVMSLFTLYQEGPRPVTRAEVCAQLAGNLCRCTGYRPIIAAALEACAEAPADRFTTRREATARALAALQDDAGVFVGSEARFLAAPSYLDEAADLLLRHPDATILAGATDVGLWVTKRLMDLPKIVWLGRVTELARIDESPDRLRLGAGVSLEAATPTLGRIDPDLAELMRRFGSRQVRASGTVGGNIANGSPIGDLAPALIALDATLDLRRGQAVRSLPVEDFFLAYGKQDRAPGELVTGLVVPRLGAHEHFRSFKLSKRFDEDISAVMGAFRLTVEGDRIVAARVAYGGMAATPRRAAATEQALEGARLSDPASWAAAIGTIHEDFQPISDMRASAAYRLKGAQALLQRALSEVAGTPDAATRLVGLRPAPLAAE